ncbi:MAG: branched-chain amino acid aminotransferase [Eubacteriales bacterium]
MDYNFKITRTKSPGIKPDSGDLSFGTVFTDHMFIMDYSEDKGWYDGRIIPYGPIALDPAATVFHYGQEMFEGLKAYKTATGKTLLFRPEKNAERMNNTNARICLPYINPELVIEAIKTVVKVDEDWIPTLAGTSLYIRPFIIATEAFLGVRASKEYKFIIIMSPVGAYYKGGLMPTKIFVEDEYVRAVPGGTGEAKVGGNYAASLLAQQKAAAKGYSQVLWLDGIERKYVEEIGTSNAFFVIDNEVITAPLSGTILPGITRDSVITLLKSWGIKVSEKRLTIEEIYQAGEEGRLDEAFATGTAATISPVGELCWKDNCLIIRNSEIGDLSRKIYDTIVGIQNGKVKDSFGWTMEI